MPGPSNVEEYLADLPTEARTTLEQVRSTIRFAAPEASEGISYGMPTFKVNGRALLWYAAYKAHYSLYPATTTLVERLGDQLKAHVSGRGTLRFAYDEPVPTTLIEQIARVRLEEEAARG